jgi:hypothetical protein
LGERRNTYEVVGVVRDSRQASLRDEIETRFYTPISGPRPASMDASVASRLSFGSRGERSILADVRQVIQRTEPSMR